MATSRDIYPPALKGVKEYSVALDGIEFKHGAIAKAKTNNYMHNALVAKSSAQRGGFIGIMLDEEGYIIEGSIGNVAFVTSDNKFLIPANESRLDGTTLKNAMKKIKQMVEQGQLKEIIEIPVKPSEIYNQVKEMLLFKGDDVIPVLEFDDIKVSNEIGPICAQLQQFMFDIAEEDAIPIDEFLKLIDRTQSPESDEFQEEHKLKKPISQLKFEILDSNIQKQEGGKNNQEIYRIRSSSCCNDLFFESSPDELNNEAKVQQENNDK